MIRSGYRSASQQLWTPRKGPAVLARPKTQNSDRTILVAGRLGHDLKTLLRTYAHVIRQDEDRVRAIVDVTLGGDAEDWLRTEVV
jgi:hypothetical protein